MRPDDRPPTISDFTPPDEDELGQHYLLLKADPIPGHSIFILCGEGLRADLGGEPVGRSLRDPFPKAVGDNFGQACAEALKRREPVHIDGAYDAGDGMESLFRSVFLPLSSGRAFDPGYLFGAFRSKRSEAGPPGPS